MTSKARKPANNGPQAVSRLAAELSAVCVSSNPPGSFTYSAKVASSAAR